MTRKRCLHAEAEYVEGCRICFLWADQGPLGASFRALYTGPQQLVSSPCRHLGRRARNADGSIKTKWCSTG